MLARNIALSEAERHYVLQLVSESVRAAQLIECRPRPNTGCQGLIEQPAIHENIHGRLWGSYLHVSEDVVPLVGNLSQDRAQVSGAKAPKYLTCVLSAVRLAQEKYDR